MIVLSHAEFISLLMYKEMFIVISFKWRKRQNINEQSRKITHFKSQKLICISLNEQVFPRITCLSTQWRNPCWQAEQRDGFFSWSHSSGGILALSLNPNSLKSFRFPGYRLATRRFSSFHRFSIELRSTDCLGHSVTAICFFRHSFVALATGPLIHPPPVFWLSFLAKPLQPLCPSIGLSMWQSCPVLLAIKQPKASCCHLRAYRMDYRLQSMELGLPRLVDES